MKDLWQVYSGAVSSEYCDYIIHKGMQRDAKEAVIGHNANGPPSHDIRRSTVRWLDANGQDQDIGNFLLQFVNQSNRTNFGFDIERQIHQMQFTEYHSAVGGKYDWHHDVFFDSIAPYQRKISIVVQLTDPSEYEGGDFEFFNIPTPTTEQLKPRGSVLVFPSFFYHRVTPITSGDRMSLVSWIDGPAWR